MRIISITNQKGGCGKTTTAINLAASLAVNNKKVLLIDLDPQSHATLGLNIKSNLTIYNVLSKLTNKKARLEEIIRNFETNLDIAPSAIILSTLEQELTGEIGRESRLSETLSGFKGKYDYCLIDCPPNLGILTINAICASNQVIIPVEASRFSLEGLAQLIDIMNLIRDRLNHIVNYRILVTNFDSRLRHSFKILAHIRLAFKDKLFTNIIHVNVKLKEAQSQGTPVLNYDKYCRGAKDYFSLSREIITQEEQQEIPPPKDKQKIPQAKDAQKSRPEQKSQRPEKKSSPDMGKRMEDILKEKLPSLSEIIFSLPAPEAKEVHLVGDFNNWKVDNNSRMEHNNGAWIKKLSLKSGRYRYRFVVDGTWTEDAANPEKEINPYGQMDSLIKVEGSYADAGSN